MRYLKKIDRRILRWAYQRPYKNSFIIKALIFLGDGPFWMIVVFAAALAGQLFDITPLSDLSVLMILGFIIGNTVFVVCKNRVKRKRPYADAELQHDLGIEILNRDPGHGSREMESFPSGHVVWTTLCICLISFQFGYAAIFLFGWMIPAMMYLRPHLGVHYPSDVVAGLALGILSAAVVISAAPFILGIVNGWKDHNGYIYGYWAFVSLFLILGFKSWLKRV